MQRRNRGSASWWLTRAPGVVAAVLLCGVPALAGGSAAAAAASPARAGTANPSADDWPVFHLGTQLQGWAANSPVTTANAGKLGVKWAADLYGAAVDSPVEAYDSTLKERLAYIGTENGDLLAINVANGNIVWSVFLGSEIRSGQVVANGAVFAATYDSTHVYKVNATTGAIECSFSTPYQIEGTPVAVTPKGGVPTVYFGANDTTTASGPMYAFKQSNCAVEWKFTGYVKTTGSWDPLAYAVDAKGRPLLLFGTSDPDSQVYALNAVTGKEIWHYAVYNPPPGLSDVGSGVVVTPPGVNGFAGGMAYTESKLGYMYGLNLTTGAKVWDVDYDAKISSFGRNISTPARSGNNLVLGDNDGLVDLNPLNGKVLWSNDNPANVGVDSSPAIAGAAGSQVVAVGDLAGGFEVDSLATGAQLYHFQTGGYITSSPAVSGGDIMIASADGFLYDFAAGGGNETTGPATTVTSPADSSQVPNPSSGNLTVTGKATDGTGLARVNVAVQEDGPEGQWWDAATGTWVSGPINNPATVASPGATSSGWTFSYPVPAAGDAYQVTADTVSTTGQGGGNALSSFAVLPSTTSPQVKASPRFVAPGSATTVSGSGFGDSETVDITMLGKKLATATTTASGTLPPTKVTIPLPPNQQNTDFGPAALTAMGQSSGKTGTAGITVANKWAQAGYGAAHIGYEPNDANLYNSIAAGAGTYMNLSWAYQSGAAISAAPAVADDVAYTPDAAGDLVAVDIHNGAPLWTWTAGSGAALDGAPAVDTTDSLVFAGADDGTLHAVNTATGKTAWSATIGGKVFAPVFSGGHVYVTSSTGVVEALGESNGKKLWSTTLANPASTAPSLDSSAKMLFVGESNGDVKALSTTGAGQWTFSSGSAVTTPPTVSGGTVYFGAGDSVYAVTETNGTKVWSYKTGGTIGNSLALTSSGHGLLLTAGSADGNLYAIDAAKGTDQWITKIGSPVTGVASAFATFVFDTSTGVVGAGRIGSGLRLWKFTTTGGAMTVPVVVDGTVYAGGHDADLYSFTTYGQPPA